MAKRINAKALKGVIKQMVKEAAAEKKNNEQQVVNVVLPEETPEVKIVRKAYELAPEWKISGIAKRKFMGLPSSLQNGAGKEACVKEALAAHKDLVEDPTRYWIWLVDETRKLTRVWDFETTCKDAGVEPRTVAQHLILEGKAVCNAVRMEGLAAYGSNIRMFVEPLFEDEFKLFGDKVPSKTTGAEEKKEGGDE